MGNDTHITHILHIKLNRKQLNINSNEIPNKTTMDISNSRLDSLYLWLGICICYASRLL